MGVERQGFEILMTADASGVVKCSKEAADALETTSGKTKDLNTALGEGKGKLDEHGKTLEDGAGHSKLFGDKTHEAKEAVRALGESFEGVGKFARDMGSGTGIAIALIGAGVAYLVQTLRSAEEEEEKFETSLAAGAKGGLEAQATAATEAATAHQKLADQLERSATGETSLLTAMNDRVKAFDDYIKGLEKVAKAEDEAEEEKIRRQVRDKEISSEEGERKIGDIHRNAAQTAAAHDEQKAQFKLDQEKDELYYARTNQAKVAADKAAADENVRQIEHRQALDKAALAGDEGAPGAEKTLKALKEKREEVEQWLRDHAEYAQHQGGDLEYFQKQTQYADDLKRQVDAQAALVKQESESPERHAAELQRAKDAADKATAEFNENQKIITEYGGQTAGWRLTPRRLKIRGKPMPASKLFRTKRLRMRLRMQRGKTKRARLSISRYQTPSISIAGTWPVHRLVNRIGSRIPVLLTSSTISLLRIPH